jgi:hypothetical protein
MWTGYMNYRDEIAGEYICFEMDGTVRFYASIEEASHFRQSVYMLQETNSGLFYIGKAKQIYNRSYIHRCHILSSIRELRNKRVKKRFSVGVLPFHINLAQLYLQKGCLDIKFSVLHSLGKGAQSRDLYRIESETIKSYTQQYPDMILNSNGIVL